MHLIDFLSGAVAMGFLLCALHFLRFWTRTRESLFGAFSVAFVLMSAGQTFLTLTDIPVEERSSLYVFRLAAFVTIIVAIWRKNREA